MIDLELRRMRRAYRERNGSKGFSGTATHNQMPGKARKLKGPDQERSHTWRPTMFYHFGRGKKG